MPLAANSDARSFGECWAPYLAAAASNSAIFVLENLSIVIFFHSFNPIPNEGGPLQLDDFC